VVALVTRYGLLVIAVLALNFLLPRLLPGDPLSAGGQPNGPALSAEQERQLRATYRLDQPLAAQLQSYLADLAHADLGWSISRSAPVAQLIGERLPWTLALVLTAVLIAGLSGAGLGLISAWRGGAWDRTLVALTTSAAALPEFLIAMALLLALAVGLGWFPLSGGQAPFNAGEQADRIAHLALPAATLIIANLAAFLLLTRAAIRGVKNAPYLATARGKGLNERQVALRHAVPNALLPVLTLFGMRLGQVLGGAIVVERVFGVPGLGLFAFQAIQSRDYPVLQAIFLLASLSVLLANFAIEVAYRGLVHQH
jgi:peptide/nickel transport system permease protein